MALSNGLKQWPQAVASSSGEQAKPPQFEPIRRPRPPSRALLQALSLGPLAMLLNTAAAKRFGRTPWRSLSEISNHAQLRISELHNSRTPQHEKNQARRRDQVILNE